MQTDRINVTVQGGLDIDLPRMVPVEQRFPRETVEDVEATLRASLAQLPDPDLAGKRVAITVGSRGTYSMVTILTTLAGQLREWGAEPFIVPTMGSHGGATAEGQLGVLANYGITEDSVGMPIHASMDVIEAARLADGTPLYCDRIASEADGIVLLNKVKPHTSYKGTHESGLAKMAVIGLGKHKGAVTLHDHGFARFAELVPAAGDALIGALPILFGVAILENAYHSVGHIEAIEPERIMAREKELLVKAKGFLGRLLVPAIDVLIVDEIGKNIGGSGMDTNVTGRPSIPQPGFDAPPIQRIIVRGLTEATHGNGTGIGLADFTTRQCFEQIDLGVSYTNVITATVPAAAKMPLIMNDDREALVVAVKTCNRVASASARIVRIINTKEVHRILISEPCLADCEGRTDILAVGEARPIRFDETGHLLD